MSATGSFDKGAIEEWSDLKFFRPLGLRIARASFSTRITPDQITGVSLVVGLVAGRLLFYDGVALNALGVLLFVVSDIFDSADGQLARMRGTSTRFGKILDGVSDGARFTNLYIQLIARLLVDGGQWWLVLPLGIAAGIAHARQSGAVDHIRQLYMYLGEGGKGEFSLPEDAIMNSPRNTAEAAQLRFYRSYLGGIARMLPFSTALVRRLRATGRLADIAAQWAEEQRPVVRQCAWIGQNIRFLLLALTVVPQHPVWYLVITLVPMTMVKQALLTTHERRAARIVGGDTPQLAEAM